jgi:glycosyltransferase involved in cell wall biosynthesis
VLLISADNVEAKMAGPGIRYWEMAKALVAHGLDVTLAVPNRAQISAPGLSVCTHGFEQRRIQNALDDCDVYVLQGYVLFYMPGLRKVNKPMIVDLYCPINLENLESNALADIAERHRISERDLSILGTQLRAGDYFVCASERQRDFWLGMLTAFNRVNPRTYSRDRSLRALIDLVPFGLPSAAPAHSRNVLKGTWPGIGHDDKVLLWGGGVWEWFDPLTLVRAVSIVVKTHPEAKLFFMGKGHPTAELNDALPMTVYDQSVQLSRELGLHDRHVLYNEGWVPYDERANYLLEADVGVSTHHEYVENQFSFRTRLLDYVWAGLPMIVSGGDSASEELVRPYRLGTVVPPGDVGALARAITDMLEISDLRETYRSRFDHVREHLTWERAVEPLAAFCRRPQPAADKV